MNSTETELRCKGAKGSPGKLKASRVREARQKMKKEKDGRKEQLAERRLKEKGLAAKRAQEIREEALEKRQRKSNEQCGSIDKLNSKCKRYAEGAKVLQGGEEAGRNMEPEEAQAHEGDSEEEGQ